MSGRFLTLPLLCAIIIISQVDFSKFNHVSLAVLYIFPLVIGFSTPNSTLMINEYGPANSGPIHIGENGILDERLLYYGGTGLLNAQRSDALPNFYWGTHGEEVKYEKIEVADAYGVGLFGYYAGPDVYVLDKLALADPLLARLPAKRRMDWRPGHFERVMPEGYLQTLYSGENTIEDPDLHLFYEKLSIITKNNIFDINRFKEIWKMNTGQYNYLIQKDKFLYPQIIEINISELPQTIPNKTSCDHNDVISLSDSGIKILLNSVSKANIIEISLDHNDMYQIDYLLDNDILSSQLIETAHLQKPGGLSFRRFYTPNDIRENGFNAVHIMPISGESDYCIGAISLLDE